jgi:hypothetical protein
VLDPREPVHWVTGTAAPCLSIFKPLLLSAELPQSGATPSGSFDARALWWRHEQLHRAAILGDFHRVLASIGDERDAIEARFMQRVTEVVAGGNRVDRSRVVRECWREATELEDAWLARFDRVSAVELDAYRATWLKLSRTADMEGLARALAGPRS